MWLVPAAYPMLSVLCLMVELENLSLGFHSMLTGFLNWNSGHSFW